MGIFYFHHLAILDLLTGSIIVSPWSTLCARIRDVLFQRFNVHFPLNRCLLPVEMYLHHVTSYGCVTCLIVLVLHYVLWDWGL